MKKKILVVDDEDHILSLVRLSLSLDKYYIVTAKDGEEALRIVEEISPDLIVLDLMMPKLHGYEVCRILKKDPVKRHIPIIILSAKGQSADKVKGIEVGADEYITKPFDPDDLSKMVEDVLERHEK